jgi:hypothetical protein
MRLLVVGSDVEAKVASASAAAAAVVEGATNASAAFSTAAVGRFHGTPSGSPVHTDATGMMAPSANWATSVLGAPVRGTRPTILPKVASSPPTTAVLGNGHVSVGAGLVWSARFSPLNIVSRFPYAVWDAEVLSRSVIRAKFSMVGSALP